jgi:hypothetical protein
MAHTEPLFGNFWLTIQNTGNWHVSNAFDLLSVFISFPLAQLLIEPCIFSPAGGILDELAFAKKWLVLDFPRHRRPPSSPRSLLTELTTAARITSQPQEMTD